MSAIQDSYVGFAPETTYATGVAVTRFTEFISESLAGDYQRVESQATGRGARFLRADRWAPNPKGASGTLSTEVLDKNFGLWLKHAIGAVVTAGAAPYTHTVTPGDLRGTSMTVQAGRVAADGTMFAATYEGGKVASWELSNQVDGVLQLALDMDFAKETFGGAGIYAVSTPTFPTGAMLLTFVGGVVQIAGTDFAVNNVSLKGDNALKTDRYLMRTGGASKKEPTAEGLRNYTFDLTGEFESLTQVNRFTSATAAGATASITLNWSSPTAGLGLAITIPKARFDTGPVNVDSAKLIPLELGGVMTYDDSNPALTVVYTSSDATP